MRHINLTQGYQAIVDNDDYERLIKFKWQVKKAKTETIDLFYSVCGIYDSNIKNNKKVLMHRMVLNIYDRNIKVDHRDSNGLNNQKSNLRIATLCQNGRNKRKGLKSFTSKFKGVSFEALSNKWVAQIKFNGKQIKIGRFISELDAAHAYDNNALRLFGSFANINFKGER